MKKLQAIMMLVIGAVCSIAFSACTDDAPAPPTQTAAQQIPAENPYLISQEDAIANLKEFGAAFYDSDSRAEGMPEIAEVIPYHISIPKSRSSAEDSLINDILLYFVNFEKDEGFAVVSGNITIPQSVLCLTQRGRINLRDLELNQMVGLDGQPINPLPTDYPSGGNTLFQSARYSGELFINPRIGLSYVPAERDSMVGNYEFDWNPSLIDDDDEKVDPSLIDPELVSLNFTPGGYIANMCIAYAQEYKLRLADDNHLAFEYDVETGGYTHNPGVGGGTPSDSEATSEYTPWSLVERREPSLTTFIAWNQEGPYNKLYPKRHSYILGKYDLAPAGCFPISVAKLMAFFRKPSNLTFNGFDIDWDKVYRNTPHREVTDNKANLVLGVAEGFESLYFYNGTFAFPTKVARFLRNMGFISSHFEPYSFDKAYPILKSGRPTIVYTCPTKIFNAHVWNVDGYKIQERYRTTTTKRGNQILNVEKVKEVQKMIHCDFGWGGDCNGYFCDEIFDFESSGKYYPDNETQYTPPSYRTKLNILIYE